MPTKTPNESIALLQKVNSVFLGTRDFKQLAQNAVSLMTSEFKNEGVVAAIIYRVHQEDRTLRPYAFSSMANMAIDKMFPKKFEDLHVSLDDPSNLLVRAVNSRQEQEGSSLYEFVRPVISEHIAEVIQRIGGGKYAVAYPLRLKQGRVAGVLFFGIKNEVIEDKQRILLEAFRSQLELAFENVIEFERVAERYKRMVAKTFGKTHEEDVPTVRFTLRITPKQNDALNVLAKKSLVDKASFLRTLIDKASGK
jgi:hypothetical protein